MTPAMSAAIAGLKTHMQKLSVIGNNIANVNTYAYKAQRTVFEDALYTNLRTGSNGTETTGGRNPSQIGYGVRVASVDLNMATGTYSPTGKPTDCMIDGDGFFLVGDKETQFTLNANDPSTLAALTLTRRGDFDIKADGYLSDGAGAVVYGFLATGMDADGDPIMCDQLVPIRVPRMDENGNVMWPMYDDAGILRDQLAAGETEADPDEGEFSKLEIDSFSIDEVTGLITAVTKDTDLPIVIGVIAMGNVTNPNGVTHTDGPYYKAMEGAGDLTVALMGGAEDELGLDYFTNGLGDNPNTADLSDMARVRSAGTTALIGGGLELSGADLATEISEMITTQRGYQANTRIVTVTDSMLEELVNMKR